jgi:hypothetical protein
MRTWTISRGISLLLSTAILAPGVATSQTPPPPGQLRITSTPAGAQIMVNGKPTGQRTPATLLVAPGAYAVSVAGAAGQSTCADSTFTVAAAATVVIDCSSASWKLVP